MAAGFNILILSGPYHAMLAVAVEETTVPAGWPIWDKGKIPAGEGMKWVVIDPSLLEMGFWGDKLDGDLGSYDWTEVPPSPAVRSIYRDWHSTPTWVDDDTRRPW